MSIINTFSKDFEDLRKQYRIFNISAIDLVPTILIAYGVSKKFNLDPTKTIITTLIGAELIHLWFNINTPLTKKINDDNDNSY